VTELITGSNRGAKDWRLATRLAIGLKMQYIHPPTERRKVLVLGRSAAGNERVYDLVRIMLERWGVLHVGELMGLLEMRVL
jgi:hypothetical protein